MASVTSIPKPAQIIITLEDNALVADIKRALKMIRGVASVRVAKVDDDKTITPAIVSPSIRHVTNMLKAKP